ncbi:CMD domain protein [Microbacterium sp. W4I20]|uniref:CMD domain protein n=1 Tax=Microbacterium sp. W4I20 TaxID=3042262 RepID=UPI0027877225|nr:CMD domain protein [Microbacterium sp. W4I20]MDQ0728880.1 CMD domain protein [Microbacterium sp. W4I20]
MTTDIVDQLAGVTPELDALRRRRPVTRDQLQASFDALFQPVSVEHVSQTERELIAAFATRLAGSADPTGTFYADRALAADPSRAAVVLSEASDAAVEGPFGSYTELGLQDESTAGERYVPSDAAIEALGARLAAALAHTHLLVFRPREASAADITALLDAGWSADGIITLSQLVSFLAFQQRVITGLRTLAAAGFVPATQTDSEEEAA